MIESKLVGSTLYIGLSGELDESSAVFIRSKMDALFNEGNMRKVVVEMSELTFMDSTGIGVLIGRYKRLKARNIVLCVRNPSSAADRIFKMAGLYEIMPKVK